MRHQTLKNTLVALEAIPALNNTATVQGIGVDMKGWDTVAFVAAIAAQGTGGTFDMRVVGSINANFSGNVNISGALLTQVLAATSVNATYVVEVHRPTNRYVKAIIVTGNNANFSVISVRSRGQSRLPVSVEGNNQYVGVSEN